MVFHMDAKIWNAEVYQAFFRGKTTDTAKNVCAVFPCKSCLFWKWSLCDISVFPCTFESRTYFTCTKTYLFRKCRTVHHSTNKPMFSFIEACFIIHMDRLRAVYSGVEFNIISVDFSQLNEALYALQRLYIYIYMSRAKRVLWRKLDATLIIREFKEFCFWEKS